MSEKSYEEKFRVILDHLENSISRYVLDDINATYDMKHRLEIYRDISQGLHALLGFASMHVIVDCLHREASNTSTSIVSLLKDSVPDFWTKCLSPYLQFEIKEVDRLHDFFSTLYFDGVTSIMLPWDTTGLEDFWSSFKSEVLKGFRLAGEDVV